MASSQYVFGGLMQVAEVGRQSFATIEKNNRRINYEENVLRIVIRQNLNEI